MRGSDSSLYRASAHLYSERFSWGLFSLGIFLSSLRERAFHFLSSESTEQLLSERQENELPLSLSLSLRPSSLSRLPL